MNVAGKTGRGGHIDNVEVVSTDPKKYPVPSCVQFPQKFPEKVVGPMGAAVQNGTEHYYVFATCVLHTISY